MELTSKEYYLWRSFHTDKAWNRYLDYEFLETERRRIKEVEKWFNSDYLKAKDREKVGEVRYYCVPFKASKSFLKSLVDYDDEEFVMKGLTAVSNNSQYPLIMLIPKGNKIPKDYHPIRIISARRKVLVNKNLPKEEACTNALLVEDWDKLDAEFLYKDIPSEPKVISKVICDSLHIHPHLAKSFEAPILSSPMVSLNESGGISFASLLRNSPFVLEFNKTLQMMLPPEQRTAFPNPSLIKGKLVNIGGSIKFCLAERPPKSKSILSCSEGNNYGIVNKEIANKNNFGGEYSFITSITQGQGSMLDTFRTLLRKFNQTVITAFNVDKLKENVNLLDLRKNIDLDLHLNIINYKQINPIINEKLIDKKALSSIIKKDWDFHLAEMGLADEEDYILDIRVQRTVENILRLSQASARANLKKEVEDTNIKEARQIFKNNAEEFLQQPEVKGIKDYITKRKRNKRVNVVMTVLENGGKNLYELWDVLETSGLFKDLNNMHELLIWLQKKPLIWQHSNKKYYTLD